MKVARLRKAARLSSPKSYVATAEGGCANPWPSGAVVCEGGLARSAWKQDKSRPVPEGRLICLTSPRDIVLRTLRLALLETPDTPLEKFESDDVRPDGGCNRSFLATEERSH